MSDIWIKETTGTSSTAWKRAVSLFVKTTTGTTSAAWKAVTNVYVYFNSGWTRVWPLSGVFNITSPYITTSSGSTTPLYGVDGARRVGSVVWGKNGTWNANGWVINSYQYRWRAYNSSEISDLNRDSQTDLATYSSAVSLTIPATYDRKYLSFFIRANSSGGSAYNGFAESGTEYGGLQIVRQQPLNISASLSNLAPQVGNTINFSSSWNITEAYAPEAGRTTIEWYKNLNNSTTGGTFLSSGSYSYTVQSSDLNYYIYAVETTFNSGTDYDLGLNTGVSVSRITTSVVSAGLTAPTSTSIVSVSRLNDTQTRVIVSSSGGSGPYYQLYWISSSTAPTTPNYDAASTTSTVTEDFSFSNGITYYFYIRSSSENLGNTTVNGTATAGTFSAYGPTTGAAAYTFAQPSGTVSVSPSSGTAGTTTFTATPSVSASPSAQISYQWQYFEGGAFGYLAISGATSSTYTPPSNYVSIYGTSLRCQITANNGVGDSLITASSAVTVSTPVLAPTNATIPTLSPTSISVGTQLSAGIGTWNNSPTSYDIRIYRGTANVATFETLVASRSGSSTANLTYTVTQADYDSGQRYFRTFVNASNSGGSSGLIAGQERGPIATPVSIPSGGSVSLTGGNTAGSTITASTSGWSGSPTSYDVYITTALSPNIPTSSSSRVASSGGGSSTTYTITSFDTVSPVNIFRAFATASNSAGTSGVVQSSNTITAQSSAPATQPGTPGTPTNGWTGGTTYPFSWTAPGAGTVAGGGAATITNYSMRIYEATNSSGTGATLISTFNTGSGSSSYTYTSPNAALYYAASVAAINSAGLQGPYSGISQYK